VAPNGSNEKATAPQSLAAMRTVRDLILVICAVISTACLVYLALVASNLDFTVVNLTPAEMTGR
jgi:hypothetical protein